jgi:glutamyl-tRNA reductase
LIEEELKRLGPLPEGEKARLEELAHRLRSKFLHGPLETLKESSRLGMVRRTLEAIQTLFRLNRSDEIRISDRDARE